MSIVTRLQRTAKAFPLCPIQLRWMLLYLVSRMTLKDIPIRWLHMSVSTPQECTKSVFLSAFPSSQYSGFGVQVERSA